MSKKKKAGIAAAIVLAILVIAAAAVYFVGHRYYAKTNFITDEEATRQIEQQKAEQEAAKAEEEENGEEEAEEEEIDPELLEAQQNMARYASTEPITTDGNVYNVLLVGLDTTKENWVGNSDSMILISVNYRLQDFHDFPDEGSSRIYPGNRVPEAECGVSERRRTASDADRGGKL